MREVVDTNGMSLSQKRFGVKEMARIIDEAYLGARRESKSTAKVSFSPSNLGYGSGLCPRRWFYDFSGGFSRIDEADSVSIANMAYGTDSHARLQDIFEKAGILIEAETTIKSEDPPIFGFVDLVLNWQGKETIGEIKTTTQESFVAKKSKNKPAGYHLLQVLIYMKVKEAEQGFLIYENKNNQNLLIIPVFWTDENKKLIEDAWAWMKMVWEHCQDGELPKRKFSQKSINCKACNYSTHCWSDEVGEVDLPALVVPK